MQFGWIVEYKYNVSINLLNIIFTQSIKIKNTKIKKNLKKDKKIKKIKKKIKKKKKKKKKGFNILCFIFLRYWNELNQKLEGSKHQEE